jgi:hypothetical protein
MVYHRFMAVSQIVGENLEKETQRAAESDAFGREGEESEENRSRQRTVTREDSLVQSP